MYDFIIHASLTVQIRATKESTNLYCYEPPASNQSLQTTTLQGFRDALFVYNQGNKKTSLLKQLLEDEDDSQQAQRRASSKRKIQFPQNPI